MPLPYIGSGPYCYANSVAMVLGADAPDPSAIEVLTMAPFGALLVEGKTPFFSPIEWDPLVGIDIALKALGWRCNCSFSAEAGEAVEKLRAASTANPVLVGPVEIGLLLQHPGSGRAIGSDHYVVVHHVDDLHVHFHDPHGYPYSILPIADFVASWTGELLGYGDETYSFATRSDFRREREVDMATAMRAAIPQAAQWLGKASAGTDLANGAAIAELARLVDAGLESWQHGHLVYFAVRLGARRLVDAAQWLLTVEAREAAEIADNQARLFGRLQYELVAQDSKAAAQTLRELVPTYESLREALSRVS